MSPKPQNSMPDVVIWMMSGEKRIAYHRIPAYDLLYSTHVGARGKYCGKTLDLFMQVIFRTKVALRAVFNVQISSKERNESFL